MKKIIAEEIEFLTSLSTYYSAPSSYSDLSSTAGYSQELIDKETRIASRKFVLYVNLIVSPQDGVMRGEKTVNITIEDAIIDANKSVFDTSIYRIIDDEEYILSSYNLVHHKGSNLLRLVPIANIKLTQGPELRITHIA